MGGRNTNATHAQSPARCRNEMNPNTKYGLLGYFELSNWYNSNFSESEKDTIKKLYRPMGGSYETLVSTPLQYIDKSNVWLLNMIAGHLIDHTEASTIAIKVLKKGEDLVNDDTNSTDKHFLFLSFIKFYKSQQNELEVRKYATRMVDISEAVSNEFKREYGRNGVSHQGFIDLLQILIAERNYDLASHYINKAKNEEWRGPWDSFAHEIEKHSSRSSS